MSVEMPTTSGGRSARTLLAISTYNEIESLPKLIDAVFASSPDLHVLVVDDNSPDGTGEWCKTKSLDEPRLTCLHRSSKQGLGTACLAAMRYALEKEYEVFATMDADFSHDPASLPAVLEPVVQNRADIAIGSRYCPGGGIEGWPWHRRMTSRMVNAAARQMLGLSVRDCSGQFRAYRVELLRKLDLDSLHAQGYAYLEELLMHLQKLDPRIEEVPITFRDRTEGTSKLGMKEIAQTIQTFARLAWTRK